MEKMAHSLFGKTAENSRVKQRNFPFSIFSRKSGISASLRHFPFFSNLVLVFIIGLAAFLRLYRIGDYMTFLGDEGRDVLIARDILHGNFTLLGPRSSAADFFYGPVYYYIISPFLWFFNYDPVGPAVMVAVIGVATVYLVYKVATELFSSSYAGIAASALYAVSPLVIGYSRSSWNPNPLPFVSLLMLYLLYKALRQANSLRLFLVIGILLGIAMQLQYLALFLAAIVGLYTFFGSWFVKKKFDFLFLIKRYVTIFFGFLIGFSPFLAFEARHGFPNIRTIFRYIFTDDLEPRNYDPAPPLETIFSVIFRLFGRLVTRYPPPEQVNITTDSNIFLWYMLTAVLALVSLFFIFRIKNALGKMLIIIWFVVGVGLFGIYKDEIYDYHFGFMFPLPFLLVGNALAQVKDSKRPLFQYISALIFLVLVGFNLLANPFRYIPNRQKDQVKEIAEFVMAKAGNKPFNFALITGGNSDHGYRYFMELVGRRPITIEYPKVDPERKTVTDQLLVICEDPNCQPLGNSLWEVAGFGRAEIVDEWPVSVVKVYKLVHFRE